MAAPCESHHLPADATEGIPCGRLHDLPVSEVAANRVIVERQYLMQAQVAHPVHLCLDVLNGVPRCHTVDRLRDQKMPTCQGSYIAFQRRSHMPIKARLFIGVLVERFEQNGYERHWTA